MLKIMLLKVMLEMLPLAWFHSWCSMVRRRFLMDVPSLHTYWSLPAFTVFPDCIQSIAVVWRTARETETETERGSGCTPAPLTASQWDSTWELPSVPCVWILCILVARLPLVLVSLYEGVSTCSEGWREICSCFHLVKRGTTFFS